MTALDSLEHLPNHACYGKKIHEGYMRKKTWLFVLMKAGAGAGSENREERREKDVIGKLLT